MIRLELDTSVANKWCEVDAVELVGTLGTAEATQEPTTEAETTQEPTTEEVTTEEPTTPEPSSPVNWPRGR